MGRPTHFVALPLPSPALHAGMAALQDRVVAHLPKVLSRCVVPPAKAHLTLFVLEATTPERVEAASDALRACGPLAAGAFPVPPQITLRGCGSFSTRVLFSQVGGCDLPALDGLAGRVADEFARRGVIPPPRPGDGAWTPHLTLLMTSKAPRGAKIPRASWEALEHEADLGTHSLDELALCSMSGVGVDGFYPILARVPIGGGPADPGLFERRYDAWRRLSGREPGAPAGAPPSADGGG